jgi:hypothetical protein
VVKMKRFVELSVEVRRSKRGNPVTSPLCLAQ